MYSTVDYHSTLSMSRVPYSGSDPASQFTTKPDFLTLTGLREAGMLSIPSTYQRQAVFGVPQEGANLSQRGVEEYEFTLNYLPTQWVRGSLLHDLWFSRKEFAFQLSLSNLPVDPAVAGRWDGSAFFFRGRPGRFAVNPSLSDVTTLTLSVLVTSRLEGPILSTTSFVDPQLSLFQNYESGFWYDLGDPDSLFTTSSGSETTNTGGNVGRVRSQLPVNVPATASGSARPTLRRAGGLNWLEHDGVDDQLSVSLPNTGETATTLAWVDANTIFIGDGPAFNGATFSLPTDDWHQLLCIGRDLTLVERNRLAHWLANKASLYYVNALEDAGYWNDHELWE